VGSNPSSIHQVYDPVTNTWSTAANTISPRFGHGLAAAGGKIYTVTNWPGNGSVEEYDPATNSWTTRANYPVTTYGIAVGSINGKVYASGGNGSAAAYVFDPATNSWTALPNSPVGGPGCNGAVYNNRFYMFRAQSGGGNASAYFDPLSNAWQTVLSPSDVDFEGDYANACGEAGGKIYLIGGRIPNTSSYVSTNREFDPNQPAELFLHCQD
jgi:N-acetylneuraminic acid mutarotase